MCPHPEAMADCRVLQLLCSAKRSGARLLALTFVPHSLMRTYQPMQTA